MSNTWSNLSAVQTPCQKKYFLMRDGGSTNSSPRHIGLDEKKVYV
jgi:hypothetical protein